MRQKLLITGLLIVIGLRAFAQNDVEYEPKFQPQSPQIMAQGGSFTANAKGYNALFMNPAGFSAGLSSLTIVGVNPWLYAFPDPETIDAPSVIVEDPAAGIGALNDMLTSSGTGLGFQAGLGFVGGGFGLGVILANDTYAHGPNALGVQVDTGFTAAFIAGVSFPLTLGPFTLTPGASVRPMYRIRSYEVGISNFVGLLADGSPDSITADVLAGIGLGIDLGLNLDYGPLTVALAIRDFGGTKFEYGQLSFAEAFDGLQSGQLPEGTPVEGTDYVIPMSAHFGVQFHPDLGGLSFLFDPWVHAELTSTFNEDDSGSLWTNLRLGTEVRVLRFIRLRAGLNQGYPTMGIGVKLLFLEAHVAYFARELGTYPGARPGQGVTAEVALRF